MLGPAVTANSQLVPLDARNRLSGSLRCFFGMNVAELADLMVTLGEPKWRGRQLAEATYRQRIVDVDGISTLPKALRQKFVEDGWQVGRPRIVQVFQSVDGTERYLVQGQSQDGMTVETVWMPEGDEGETGDGSETEGGSEDPSATPGTRASLRRSRATICAAPSIASSA
jgi:23S rRNA (adenine2503-C2)-methyltransferase